MRSQRKSLLWIICIVIVGAAILSCWFFITRRRSTIERQFHDAADIRVSSKERLIDIDDINGSNDTRTTQFLLRLAVDNAVPFDSRNAAVAALAKRHDPAISADLAILIQPHTSESLRHAVATTLLQLSCSTECVQDVLHYLERMWRGEANSEDIVTDDLPTKELLQSNPALVNAQIAQVQADQQQLISQLNAILLRNRFGTIEILQRVYGLGSVRPSPFALHIVGELHLPEACPSLRRPHLDEMAGEKLGNQIRIARELACE
jgi:hypothetical protein